MVHIFSLVHGESEKILLERLFIHIGYLIPDLNRGFSHKVIAPNYNQSNVTIHNYKKIVGDLLKPSLDRLDNVNSVEINVIIYIDVEENGKYNSNEEAFINKDKAILDAITERLSLKNIKLWLLYNRRGIENALGSTIANKKRGMFNYVNSKIEKKCSCFGDVYKWLNSLDDSKSNLKELRKLVEIIENISG